MEGSRATPDRLRILARLRTQALVAALAFLAVLSTEHLARPWATRMERAVAWTLSTHWQTSGPVQRAQHRLVDFAETRSWGAFLDLWSLAARTPSPEQDVPVARFSLTHRFGWVKTAHGFRFEGAAVLSVPHDSLVRAPGAGRVVQDAHHTVAIVLRNGTRLQLHPLTLLSPEPDAVRQGTPVGRAASTSLVISAMKAGIPVNPSAPHLYDLVRESSR